MVIFLFNNLSFANLLSYFLISVSLERGKFKGTRENLNHKNWDQLGSQQSSFLLNPDFTEFHLHTRLFFLFLLHGYYIPQFQHARMNEGFPTPLCIRELKGTFINDVLDQGTVVPFLSILTNKETQISINFFLSYSLSRSYTHCYFTRLNLKKFGPL